LIASRLAKNAAECGIFVLFPSQCRRPLDFILAE